MSCIQATSITLEWKSHPTMGGRGGMHKSMHSLYQINFLKQGAIGWFLGFWDKSKSLKVPLWFPWDPTNTNLILKTESGFGCKHQDFKPLESMNCFNHTSRREQKGKDRLPNQATWILQHLKADEIIFDQRPGGHSRPHWASHYFLLSTALPSPASTFTYTAPVVLFRSK